jgi:hypothetical protein
MHFHVAALFFLGASEELRAGKGETLFGEVLVARDACLLGGVVGDSGLRVFIYA